MADLKKLKAIHSEYLKNKGLSDPKKLSWEDCRRRGVGGSDIGAICGKNKYKTAIEVFQDKTVGSSFTGNDITEFGHIMEPHIADMFQKKYGELFEVKVDKKHYQCKDYPWLNGNIDRKLIDRKTGAVGVLEIKTTGNFDSETWGKGCAFGLNWRLVAEDSRVPDSYYYQVQHYLLVTGYTFAWLCAYSRDKCELRIYKIDVNKTVQNIIMKIGTEFWFNNVIQGVAPSPNTPDIMKSNGDALLATPDVVSMIDELKQIKVKAKQLEEREKELKEKVQNFMRENEVLTDGQKTLATWKSYEKRGFNSEKFKRDNSNLYNEYLKLSSCRTFLIKE